MQPSRDHQAGTLAKRFIVKTIASASRIRRMGLLTVGGICVGFQIGGLRFATKYGTGHQESFQRRRESLRSSASIIDGDNVVIPCNWANNRVAPQGCIQDDSKFESANDCQATIKWTAGDSSGGRGDTMRRSSVLVYFLVKDVPSSLLQGISFSAKWIRCHFPVRSSLRP